MVHLHGELSEQSEKKFKVLCAKKGVSQQSELGQLVAVAIAQYEAEYGRDSLD